MLTESSSVVGGDSESEDDFDWEEVIVPEAQAVEEPVVLQTVADDVQEGPSARPSGNIEITIQAKTKKQGPLKKSAKGEQLYAQRLVRLDCHKIHTVCLLANARTRNKWINDPLLHARLMSLAPLSLQNAFALIHKSRVPEAAQRGRLFEAAINRLTEWWSASFRVDPTGHIRSRTFEDVQQRLGLSLSADPAEARRRAKGKERAIDVDEEDAEVIRSEKSLMKHALMFRGSRDASAQLFTALCRALGIPARLVVSLQSVPWQANAGKSKSTAKKKGKEADGKGNDKEKGEGKGKEKAVNGEAEEGETAEDDDMEEVVIPAGASAMSDRGTDKGKGRAMEDDIFPVGGQRLDGGSIPAVNGTPKDKGKAKAPPIINLRKSRGKKLGSAPNRPPRRERTPDPTTSPPVFWTEVFSRADARWLPVDPVRCIVNRRKVFDPTPNASALTKSDRNRPVRVENRLVYVLAFEEDGYARDVTPRYAREYGAKVAKVQQGGRGRQQWWEGILGLVTRPYRLNRDDLEDDELQIDQLTERMPTTMTGFKDHPLYVLARHLRRDEVIHPLREIGKFRGEPVYSRSAVLSLKTAENWMRQGRKVREGCQPMKWVKQRAMTVNKKRAIEMALAEQKDKHAAAEEDGGDGFASEGGVMQGLYAENQTELYVPNPVIDGRVPKNDFGNIDLYVPSMLPAGGTYIPYKGAAKVARQLGFDFAEAVTGFEFKKRRAFPIISGIVVAAENEQTVLEAFWEAEQDAEEKRRAKREEQVLKRWTKLVQGLRIRQRLQEQYADNNVRESSIVQEEENKDAQLEAGGFLTGADDVVQPFTLPKNLHEMPRTSTTISLAPSRDTRSASLKLDEVEDVQTPAAAYTLTLDENHDEDEDLEEIVVPIHMQPGTAIPKSIRELAEDAARQQADLSHEEEESRPVSSLAQDNKSDATKGTSTPSRSARSTRSGTGTPAATSRKAKASAQPSPRRSRKRPRKDADNEDAESEPEIATASPSKRTRASAPGSSDRVLRTRVPKSATQVQEEKDMELAYRRAVAE
ncbi:Rad4-domain-containing protein [Sparassis crispa]|uniref:Rad4-domain-containing protein n=1 Tax=Sparassis crispa TaxID=139825 RepID=A0A401GSG6_9APHY|nr:Rad4-domain-containing protein [Sparassis crispa]GBE85109.1 Rad4-domain-containing protein [Sparassis crispa]